MDSYTQQSFSAKDGLQISSPTAIAQTPDGFLWFGGYGGLARYDGKNFQIYGIDKLSNVKCLLTDDTGALWIGTSDKGLVKYEKDEMYYLPLAAGTPTGSIECLIQTENGIYFGTQNGLGKVNDSMQSECLHIEELKGLFVRKLAAANGMIYAVTRDGEVFVYDGSTCVKAGNISADISVRSMTYCPISNQFYLGTADNQILRYDADLHLQEIRTIPGIECINDIICGEDGSLTLCADNGVVICDGDTIRKQNLTMDNSVEQMMVDFEGNYWFISSRKGVLKVSNSRFFDISRCAGIGDIVTNAVLYSERENYLYIGHDQGLEIVDLKDMSSVKKKELADLGTARVRDIFMDNDGNIWICTKEKGILCQKTDDTVIQYIQENFPSLGTDAFRCAAMDENGKVYAGSEKGIYAFADDQVEPALTNMEELPYRILDLAFMDGTCYAGTDGYGLFEIRDGAVQKIHTVDEDLTSNVIMKFARSKTNDTMWAVTGNGIICLDNTGTVLKNVTIPGANVLDIVLSENGTAWVTASGALYRFTENALMEDGADYELLSQIDGIPYDCTPNSSQSLTEDILYLCGTEGVYTMDLSSRNDRYENYPLTMDYIQADDESIYVQDTDYVEIPSDTKRLSLALHIPSYIPENPTVFYYLEEFDTDKNVMKLRELSDAVYTNLDGGVYQFHFGIINSETGEVAKEKILTIEKSLKFMEKKSALLLIGAAALAIFITLLALYLNSKEKRIRAKVKAYFEKEEQEKLKTMAFHDYLTGLYNRNYITRWKALNADSQKYPISIIAVDCNDLKKINDKYGHDAGDRYLVMTANLLKEHFSDEDCSVLRTGGDEFLIFCQGQDREECQERMNDLMADAKNHSIHGHAVSVCYGIYAMENEFNFDDCMRLADLELLRSKRLYHQLNDPPHSDN
ncbi:MAG: diguanylate cyclase [Clostridiales bacterium]|nr:diguanylate cyclase [Candidatus Blautia equi]